MNDNKQNVGVSSNEDTPIYIQNVILILSDGRKYAFYGNAIPETLEDKEVIIEGIEITKPLLLPNNIKITNDLSAEVKRVE
jgi:hypothetical protein